MNLSLIERKIKLDYLSSYSIFLEIFKDGTCLAGRKVTVLTKFIFTNLTDRAMLCSLLFTTMLQQLEFKGFLAFQNFRLNGSFQNFIFFSIALRASFVPLTKLNALISNIFDSRFSPEKNELKKTLKEWVSNSSDEEILQERKNIEQIFLRKNPRDITKLRIEVKFSGELPDVFAFFPNLKTLHLHLSRELACFPLIKSLKHLVISSERVAQLPDQFQSFRNLTQLNLLMPELTEIPPSIGGLHLLNKLCIHNNQSTLELDHLEIKKQVNLREILKQWVSSSSNNATLQERKNIERALLSQNASRITELELHVAFSEELPDVFGYFPNLKTLHLHLSRELACFPLIKSLKYLVISSERVAQLPNQFQSFPNLTQLNLLMPELTEIPSSIGSLPLQHLFICNTKIETIPSSFSKVNIERLGIEKALQLKRGLKQWVSSSSNNATLQERKNIERALLSQNASRTTELELHVAFSEELPDVFGYFPNLKTLHLHLSRELACFPLIKSLKHLVISSERVAQLPDQFQSFPNLARVDLFMPELTALPSSIVTCSFLQRIFASNAKIKTIPSSFSELNLWSTGILDLSGNSLKEIDLSRIPFKMATLKLNNNALEESFWENFRQRLLETPNFFVLELSGNNFSEEAKRSIQNQMKALNESEKYFKIVSFTEDRSDHKYCLPIERRNKSHKDSLRKG